jgi:cell division FtsZ-interacting protein ZapD
MTTTVVSIDARRAHQQHVTSLLEELDRQRRHLYRLKAGGARRAGVRGLKTELESTRRRLLSTVDLPPAA